ncbi:MAG TPA: hypothetical protein PK141_25840 [Polyangiaceae bacterium]|nr:hypothetical protein [Polyangiaceae bacterium]
MSPPPDNVILCEGYHDRAFLAGWLEALGCTSCKDKEYRRGKPLRGRGQFGFYHTTRDVWARVVPVRGDGNMYPEAELILEGAKTDPIANLVRVVDRDTNTDAGELGMRRASFEGFLAKVGANGGRFVGFIDTQIRLVEWHVADAPATVDLPAKETLERLVCAAIQEVYPARGQAIASWLQSRPDPPRGEKAHKTIAASHMAGWYSERGYEGLFGAVWEDAQTRAALGRLLEDARRELAWLVPLAEA